MFLEYRKNHKFLYCWFFAFLLALLLVLTLVLNVGVVDAASSDSSSTRAVSPTIYDSVPEGYTTFQNAGFNMNFTNDNFTESLNMNDLDSVDSSHPVINSGGLTPYGWTRLLVYFDNDLSNGEYFLPETFTYNGNSFSFSDLFDSCLISCSSSTTLTCKFYNSSTFNNHIIVNTTLFGTTSITRTQYEDGDDSFKLSNGFPSVTCSSNDMLFGNFYFNNNKYMFRNPGPTESGTYLIGTNNTSSFASACCLSTESLYYSDNFDASKHYGFTIDSEYSENLYDYNYLLQYWGGNGNNVSNENDSNNMFLNNAHWSFNIPSGNDSRGIQKAFVNNGKAVFSGLLNTYQNSHLSNFYFHYTFYIQPVYQSGTGSGDSGGGGHPMYLLGALKNSSFLSDNDSYSPPVFQFNVDGQTYYEQTMSEFNSAGQSCTFFTYDYLWEHCLYNGQSFRDYVDSWHFTNMTNCYLYCTAVMFSTGGLTSSPCQAWYDLATGQSGVTMDGMQVNPNPYVPNTNSNVPNSNNSQFGNIIINNTNNNTLNGGSGLPLGSTATQEEQATFFQVFNPIKFFLSNLIGNNRSTAEDVSNSVGVNSWLTLMTNTFSFIPSSFWGGLSTFFIVSLGILIIGLIFRVILDLL